MSFLFIRVPHYVGDLKKGPNLENSPDSIGVGIFRRV